MAASDYSDIRSRIISQFPHLTKDNSQEKSIDAIAITNFINCKPDPRRSYSCFRESNDDWNVIRKMESYMDLDRARLDIRGKSRDLLDKIKPLSTTFNACESASNVAEEAVNHAQWAFDSANLAIATLNKTAAVAVADYEFYNAVTAATRPEELKPETKDNPTNDPAYEDIPMDYERDYELEIKRFSEQARKALDYYKDTKDEEFELVEITDFERNLAPAHWITHFTFTAKPRDIPDSCPKLFFAEVYESGDHLGEYEVKMCMTLDPFGPDVMKGCGYVQHDMLHPKGVKFWAGPPSETPDIGSSSYDAR